jgi:hypothetical protein
VCVKAYRGFESHSLRHAPLVFNGLAQLGAVLMSVMPHRPEE